MDMQVGTDSRTIPAEVAEVMVDLPSSPEGLSDSSSAMGWNRKSLEMPPHIEAEV